MAGNDVHDAFLEYSCSRGGALDHPRDNRSSHDVMQGG
jgi:hypothetical protein